MNIRSGLMRLNARKYSLIHKSRSYFTAPRAIACKYSLLSTGIASDRRCTKLVSRPNMSCQLRLFSSEAAAHDAENKTEETSHDEAEQENPPSTESEKVKPRLSKRGERFRNEFLSRIVPWEKIPVSFDNFPYYIDDDTKTLLMECAASHLKRETKFRKYGSTLRYSSNRIQLQSIAGTDLYRERLVSAVARELHVPLLKLDSSVLPPYDISQKYSTVEPVYNVDSSDSDRDYPDYNYSDTDDDSSDDDYSYSSSMPPRHKATPYVGGEVKLKKGDRVKYVGKETSIEEVKNRTLSRGTRGEVHEVNGERVAVIFNDCGLKRTEDEKEEEGAEKTAQVVTWLEEENVKLEDDAHMHDCCIAMELLYEVLESRQPIVVYFPDSFFSGMNEASWTDRHYFFANVKNMFEKLSGHVVLISGQNKTGSKETEKFPDSLKQYLEKFETSGSLESTISEIFTNVMRIKPPKDEDRHTFIKQMEEDMTEVISRSNLSVMNQVLKAHRLLCLNLEQANTTGMILNRNKAEKVVSLATNHHLASCSQFRVEGDLLHIPHQILKSMISRLEEQEKTSPSSSKGSTKKSIENLAAGSHEKQLVSAVVCAEDIGVKFDDVGALEHVKKTLYETVILPLKRPELFSHGNLAKPCKGVLLFGPPGTGKTLMAKALATEAGANFINVTTATLTSKWWGETERLTRALFTFARKLAPAIIFVDEVDSMLGARGKNEYDTSRLNEFMAAWDGLISQDTQRILVMGATNRPFDLDDAVLRRMPRRVYVGLPDAENRSKILKILLKKENLAPDFSFMQLAQATEGYSGDDLKNLCVAAAYRPVQELLERESKGEKCDGAPALRPLKMVDYLLSKSEVRASVSLDASSIQKLREWDMKFGGGNFELYT